MSRDVEVPMGMSDHLPECQPWNRVATPDGCHTCTALRACEARVEADNIMIDTINQNNAYSEGYAAGLAAARDAVAPLASKTEHPWATIADALAAIDALRGESNG